jgi:hypothetical protein
MPQTFTAPAASRADRRRFPAALCALLAAAALLIQVPPAPAQGRPAEPTVSVNVKDRPLGDVLAQMARATGSEFLIDPSWQKVPVTASFENAPLSVALKRVLSGLNHAIVYQPQNRIKIVIYESSPAGAQPALQPALSPVGPRPGRAPAQPPQPNLPPALLPQPAGTMREPPSEPEEEAAPQG